MSGSVVGLSLFVMGLFFYLQRRWGTDVATNTIGWLPLLSLMVFFAAYSGGYANVPFIVMGEVFPARYRSILGSTSSSFNFLCTLVIVRGFPAMKDGMGAHGTFWFFMCCTLLSLVFVFFLLPETRGKSLEEIERIFSAKNSIRPVESGGRKSVVVPTSATNKSVVDESTENSDSKDIETAGSDEKKNIDDDADDKEEILKRENRPITAAL